MLRSTAAGFFSQALPYLYEATERITIGWKEHNLPAYLRRPPHAEQPVPLLITLNGATTSKEEALIWSDPIIAAGWAMLCIDWPGTGESTALAPLTGRQESVLVAALREASRDGRLDPERSAVLGFSLGATPAVRAAAREPRIGAVVLDISPLRSHRLARAARSIDGAATVDAGGRRPGSARGDRFVFAEIVSGRIGTARRSSLAPAPIWSPRRMKRIASPMPWATGRRSFATPMPVTGCSMSSTIGPTSSRSGSLYSTSQFPEQPESTQVDETPFIDEEDEL